MYIYIHIHRHTCTPLAIHLVNSYNDVRMMVNDTSHKSCGGGSPKKGSSRENCGWLSEFQEGHVSPHCFPRKVRPKTDQVFF